MLRLNHKLNLNILCSKCKILRSVHLNWTLHENTSIVHDSRHKLNKPICYNYHHDVMEVYTNTLILKNVAKWKTDQFSSSNKLLNNKSNSIFKYCDDPDHLITYLKQCLEGCCKVSKSLLTQFMLTMAKHGRVNGLILIERLNEKYDYGIKKSELQMSFAEAYWTNGNLIKMFKVFEIIYPVESTKVNFVLEPIIYTIVKSRGCASIVILSNFVNCITIEHRNYYPMSILWKYLFLSELYNDNLAADQLTQQNSNLIEYIQYLVPAIMDSILKQHNIDCAHRLMVMLLKHDRMEFYQLVLKSLFEYYYMLGNVRQCKEIMKNSFELNVPLTQVQQLQLINMVFKNKQPRQINKEVTATIFKLMF
ncbi:Hypothetical protein CINCED_3A015393 [Cinara cedri]|nr:Hypothetical protein CINCED_3A015393 [Cinara cedri]